MKDIKEMTKEELDNEFGELYSYLYLTKETSTYDKFEWNGLDYWDADRRHYRISQEKVLRSLLKLMDKK